MQYPVITHNGKECLKNRMSRDFPGDPLVKTLPFPAGGAGLIPGELRSHMPWGVAKIFLKKRMSMCQTESLHCTAEIGITM